MYIGRQCPSHLSEMSLFLTPESSRFYILVDNGPWVGKNVEGQQKWLSFTQTQRFKDSVDMKNDLLKNVSSFTVTVL